MQPLEQAPFYVCRQYMGAYGTLGGVLVNDRMEVMTDEGKVIDGLYCVGTDACTIYGDSYNYSIPGNTMGFCLNSGRIAGEDYIRASTEAVKSVSPGTMVLQAAGISTGQDVYDAIHYGGDATGGTSGIVCAGDPEAKLEEMFEALGRVRADIQGEARP